MISACLSLLYFCLETIFHYRVHGAFCQFYHWTPTATGQKLKPNQVQVWQVYFLKLAKNHF